MFFGNKILTRFDDILDDLAKMVAIPSIATPQSGTYPYGQAAANAIDAAMSIAERYGLATKNVGYHAMHAEYGSGSQNAVVMAHLDVVPAGEGWKTDPFQLTNIDDKLFGRGVMDDKGSAIVALHCLRVLKEEEVAPKRKLRVVLGAAEEIGMVDMAHYFASEQKPDIGFTPDGEYGVCHCEKGILQFAVRAKPDSSVIRSFIAGTVPNAVAERAVCRLNCNQDEARSIWQAVDKSGGKLSATDIPGGLEVISLGKASHASTPHLGQNAATQLTALLYSVFGAEKLGPFFTYIHQSIGAATDGSSHGVACFDEPSGPLTFNLGIVNADDSAFHLVVDIRYPATKDDNEIIEQLRRTVTKSGLEFVVRSNEKPLYLPKESALIQLLTTAYEDAMKKPCSIYAMGGGTYARQMFGRGVAFGPSFPENPDGEPHTANEYVKIENLKRHAVICLEAMYRMLTDPLI